MPEANAAASNLVTGTACLLVHFRRPGIKRKLRDDQYEAGEILHEGGVVTTAGTSLGKAFVVGAAEKTLTGATKIIVDSPEYKAVVAFEGHVKFYLASKALPSRLYRMSTYLIPLKSMKTVDEFLEKARIEWQELVDAFVSTYPERKAETMKRLGSVADEADYKTEAEIRADFGFDFEYVTLSTPSSLKQISAEMFEREEQRLRERLETAEAQIVNDFRQEFAAVVDDMKTMLDGEEAGKARRFHGPKIDRLQNYIETFKAEKNVCGDSALVGLMDEAGKLLAGVNPKELKDNAAWRASISGSFAEISKKLSTMTAVRGKRLIDVDEEVA